MIEKSHETVHAVTFIRTLFSVLLTVSVFQNSFAAEKNFEWQTGSPESQGMLSDKLDAMRDTLAARGTRKLLVIRNDKIVCEWYAPEHGPDKRHYTASLAKALVGGMSLLLALNDSLLDTDDPTCQYIPEWREDPLKSKITIRYLATHSSGIENAEQDKIPHMQIPGWKGAFWRKEPDPFTISRDQAPVIFQPGSQYGYSNPGMAMLAYAVTASLKNGPHTDIRTLLRERIMKPIGVEENEWSIGYGKTYEVNGFNLVANWGGGEFTSRAVARIGRLMLKKGNWQGVQLIDSVWVEKVLKYAGTPLPDRPPGNPRPASGLGWYTHFDSVWEKVPCDAFAGAGAGNQVLFVVPSLNLIVVRNGAKLYDESKGEEFWGGLETYLFNPVMEAVRQSPYPPSDVILRVEFAKPCSIIRRAEGSDNWPITWADDDNLYTAYGDGWGFEPKTENKLSMGFAKVSGTAIDFKGTNIRSPDEQSKAGGGRGLKPSGMLFVDNILYMWVRNAVPISDRRGEQCRLAWSTDYAKNWTWADWTFPFGYPIFINFGKNYSGARDNYVYVVTHDNISAYEPADRFILMRVPKDRIIDKNGYEFFQGIDEKGDPLWTTDMTQGSAVFTHPGHCRRSGISYNAGLKRYLWWQMLDPDYHGESGADVRYEGGFGIFDASEPWGPWTTVYYTENWDVGPGETGSFPTKWMSEHGKTCHLLFSGDDCFSVRKVTFVAASDSISGKLRVGTCQFPISSDVISNACWIRQQMSEAKEKGVDIIHFPECAMTGYGGHDHNSLEDFDWDELCQQTQSILSLAKNLKLWIVLGSMHRLSREHKPHNCLYVINPEGKIVDRYDKRFCTRSDLKYYSPGDHFVTFTVNGVRCGLLICYDVRFPELYREYHKLGVQLIFQSFYNTRKKKEGFIHPIIMPISAQARAATNYVFMSLTNTSKQYSWPCHLITPNGLIAEKLPADRPGILIFDVDTKKHYYDASKPYRMDAIRGKLNSGQTVEDPRSRNRMVF